MRFYKFVIVSMCLFISACTQAQQQREIKSSEFMKNLKKGKNIEIANKIILDDVDFTSSENLQMLSSNQLQNVVEGNIFFTNCIFMGNVTAVGEYKSVAVQTKFNNNLVFQDCDFRGDVVFDNAVIMGSANFSKAKFRKDASFNNIMVWAKDSYFSEVEAEGTMNMIYATFNGNLYMRDAVFQQAVSFQGMTVQGMFAASGMKCSKMAEFDMLTVGQRANFNYSSFAQQPTFNQARFHDDAEFVGDTINNMNEVFEKTYIYGKLQIGDTVYPSSGNVEQILQQKGESIK